MSDANVSFIGPNNREVPVSSTNPLPCVLNGSLANVTHTPIIVLTSTTVVLAANLNRKYLLIENDSDTTIYISYGVAAANNQGVRLNANGGSHEFPAGLIFTGAINAINSSGSKNLLVTEGV